MKKFFSYQIVADFALYINVFLLPFFMGIPNLLFGVNLLILLFCFFKKRAIKSNKSLLIISVLVFYLLLNFAFKNQLFSNFSLLGRIFIVPLFLLILLQANTAKIIKSFWFSYAVLTVLVLIKIIKYYIDYQNLNFSTIQDFNTLLFIDRPYFGFVSLLGIIFNVFYFNKKYINKYILLVLSCFSVILIFLLAARLSMITGFILLLVYIFLKIKVSFLRKSFLLIVLSGIFISSLFFNQNFINRLVVNQGVTTFIDYEPRFVIWPCGSSIVLNNPSNIVFGYGGFSEVQNNLCACYEKDITNPSKKDWYLLRKFNSHNQFLGFLLIGGIVGLSLFLWFLLDLFNRTKHNFYTLSIWISFVLFLFLENVFYRQFGCYLIALIILFLTQFTHEKNKGCSYT